MNKIAQFIIKWKNIIFIFILAITIGCGLLIPKVSINYDMSKYLPNNSEVSNGITIMKDEFGLISNASVMVKDVSLEDCLKIENSLKEIEGVQSVSFDNTEQYYKDNTALFSMTLESRDSYEDLLNNVKSTLRDYEIAMRGSAVSSQAMTDILKEEMPVFLIVAVILILIILLLIANSWLEPLLFLSISAIAIVINYGTNIMFTQISFVTFAIAALLQLALSMDYSIMLLDQYHHELKDSPKEKAMSKAWKKSFSAISASSLTTIFGLLAMLFMSFTIGRDLGLVLAKGIIVNVLVVFLALPSLILIFDKVLNKTKKKPLRIPIKILSILGFKGRYAISILMILFTIGAFFVQRNLNFSYSIQDQTEESEIIVEKFGTMNQFVLLYQENDSSKVQKVLQFLSDYKIKDTPVVNNVIDYYNTIAKSVSVEEIVSFTHADSQLIREIFNLYNNLKHTTVDTIPLNEFLDFIYTDLLPNEAYAALLDDTILHNLNQAKNMIDDNTSLLVHGSYKRMIIEVNVPVEGEEAFQFYNDFQQNVKENLTVSYLLGDTALAHDIEASFADETLVIMIITIISMLIIIGLTYRSVGLPLILVTLIQGAIWIGLCYPVIANNQFFFLAYIIAQCIQMGATIDYAILLSSNYMNNRAKQGKKEAIFNAIKASIMTIFTSATILIAATFTIAIISSQEMISTICIVIGRGTIISAVVVLVVLPASLVLYDRFLEKTTWKKKFLNEKENH